MEQSSGHHAIVKKLYALYKEKGFLREEEALAVMTADGVSLVGINRITDKLIALGVIFADDSTSDDDEDYDRARIDYEALYAEVIEISPGQQMLVEYIKNVRPPQYLEWRPLIAQMNSGNEYAFKRLFDMYLRNVLRIALQFYKKNGIELDDAIQEGCIGLIKAINKYDATKHELFGSYLSWWIQQYISKAVANNSRTIRLPVKTYEMVQRLLQSQKILTEKLGRDPLFEEIAISAETNIDTAMELLEAAQDPISLDMIYEDNEIGDRLCYYTHFFDDTDDILNMYKSLSMLPEREQKVLLLRYGLFGAKEWTLEEVSSVIDVTRERVRQIANEAVDKMRLLMINMA